MLTAKKILIIEDNLLQYRVTERQLAKSRMDRFDADWAQTYEDGLRLLLTGDYAACLLDYQLGEHDGLELLRAARAQGCNTPVIFLTADSSDQVDAAAMDAGAADYLVKGEITPRTLERAIRYSLKLAAAMQELRQLATHDALTGLLNRRAFDGLITDEIQRALRFGRPLALVLLDLDHFKAINDNHGHPAGDRVLTHLASVLNAEVRGIDRIARIGGEEFAVLLMETPVKDAISIGLRIVEAVRSRPISLPDGDSIKLTISAGVALLGITTAAPGELMAAADRALYAAKRGGRDTAVLAS